MAVAAGVQELGDDFFRRLYEDPEVLSRAGEAKAGRPGLATTGEVEL